MKLLITGATGFIGQHLLDELKDDNFSIRILSRRQRPEFWCSNQGFEVLQGDISDKSSLEKAFDDIDIVVNLAAELRDSNNFKATNINGIKNILELCEKNNIRKVIHLSSVGVVGMQYSRKKIVVDENYPCNPKNEYEKTKLISEQLLNEFGKKGTTEVNILRPTNVFGDHHSRKALLGFLQRVREGKSFPVAKNAAVNYVYVKDVANALRFCLMNNIGNKTFNVGEPVSFRTFHKLAVETLNSKSKTINTPPFIFDLLDPVGYFGIEKLQSQMRGLSNGVEYSDNYMKNTIGYKFGLKIGLTKTIAFYNLK